MSKLTLEEKRLQQLRMQLFGKERKITKVIKPSSGPASKMPLESKPTTSLLQGNQTHEAKFLKQDISKVMILSLLAVGSQIVLYYLSTQGIIRLDVFHLF